MRAIKAPSHTPGRLVVTNPVTQVLLLGQQGIRVLEHDVPMVAVMLGGVDGMPTYVWLLTPGRVCWTLASRMGAGEL